MPIFRCDCCFYTTHLKQHYTTHLKSKKHLNNEKKEHEKKEQTKLNEHQKIEIKPIINHYKFIIELPKNLTPEEQLTYIDNFKKYQIHKLLNEIIDDNSFVTVHDKNTQLFLNNQEDKINISTTLINETINKNIQKKICKNCNKEFSSRQSLFVHKKKCKNIDEKKFSPLS